MVSAHFLCKVGGGASGWEVSTPLMLAETELCSKHHLANSPVCGHKGTGFNKWKPQPQSERTLERELESRLSWGNGELQEPRILAALNW